MNKELKEAIKLYASMLPYPNTGANPHDDQRLFHIAKLSHESKENVSREFLRECLQDNPQTNIDEAQLEEFINNRLSKIDEVKYILDRLD